MFIDQIDKHGAIYMTLDAGDANDLVMALENLATTMLQVGKPDDARRLEAMLCDLTLAQRCAERRSLTKPVAQAAD